MHEFVRTGEGSRVVGDHSRNRDLPQRSTVVIRGVLFDVDGTLYRQAPVRLCMAAELACALARRTPEASVRIWQTVRAFRQAQERLRGGHQHEGALAELQVSECAAHVGVDQASVRQVTQEWMFRRPLKHLKRFRRRGVQEFLAFLKSCRIEAGVLSDYPVRDKIRALGLERGFSVALCTTDPEINAFKPDPKGFWRACELWNLEPEEVLYVGDRPSVDAAGAAAAGMPCAIVTYGGQPRWQRHLEVEYLAIGALRTLEQVLAWS